MDDCGRLPIPAFEQGSSSLLLNLYGSLPVSFRGTTYAFPISIWVPREYPHVAPMQFVTPTKEMLVRPGQHVSADGRIYHPYLANWRNDVSGLPMSFTQPLQLECCKRIICAESRVIRDRTLTAFFRYYKIYLQENLP